MNTSDTALCGRCHGTIICDRGEGCAVNAATRSDKAQGIKPAEPPRFSVGEVCAALHVPERLVVGERDPEDAWPSRPERAEPVPLSLSDRLEAAGRTARARNAEYGANYRTFGPAFTALFPGGVLPVINTPEEMNRLATLIQIMSKLTRYCANFHKGGHWDSAHDIMVYAAMLEEQTKVEEQS